MDKKVLSNIERENDTQNQGRRKIEYESNDTWGNQGKGEILREMKDNIEEQMKNNKLNRKLEGDKIQ